MSYLLSSVGLGLPSPGLTEWISPRLSRGSQQFCSDFPHTDGPWVSSENAEGSLAWRFSSRLGGQRLGWTQMPKQLYGVYFLSFKPSVIYYSTQCILEIQFVGYMTHIVNWDVLSQFICWRTGVHITRTNSPIDSNWCLGWQSEPRGQGLKVHEEWTHNNFHTQHSVFYLRLSVHIFGIHSLSLQHCLGLVLLSCCSQENKSKERKTLVHRGKHWQDGD